MNENEVESNIATLLPNRILFLVYSNVDCHILHLPKCTEKLTLDVSILGLKLGNHINFYEAIELLNFSDNFRSI